MLILSRLPASRLREARRMADRPAPSKNTAIGVGRLAEEHKASLARIIPEVDRRRALQAWAVRASRVHAIDKAVRVDSKPSSVIERKYFQCNGKTKVTLSSNMESLSSKTEGGG
jgi:hypothetical protein